MGVLVHLGLRLDKFLGIVLFNVLDNGYSRGLLPVKLYYYFNNDGNARSAGVCKVGEQGARIFSSTCHCRQGLLRHGPFGPLPNIPGSALY